MTWQTNKNILTNEQQVCRVQKNVHMVAVNVISFITCFYPVSPEFRKIKNSLAPTFNIRIKINKSIMCIIFSTGIPTFIYLNF